LYWIEALFKNKVGFHHVSNFPLFNTIPDTQWAKSSKKQSEGVRFCSLNEVIFYETALQASMTYVWKSFVVKGKRNKGGYESH